MSSESPRRDPEEQEPWGDDLTLLLWVIVVLLAVLELTWLWAARMYSG